MDDILIITRRTETVNETKAKICATFEARGMGAASIFLGMVIILDRTAHTISLVQRQLTNDLLDRHGMAECKPLSVPLSTAIKLTKDGEPLDTSVNNYSQLIGSLMYLSISTRPDIAQAVGALQPAVAASTTEAEYMAADYSIKEGLWLRTLLRELGMKINTITICADSQSAIKLLKNPVFSMRSKHIDVIYHFARERVERKDVAFTYISTDKMVADILTKPLTTSKFNYCRSAMGMEQVHI